MINQMYSRIELRFWDWAIPMLSHSPRLQAFIHQIQPYTTSKVAKKIGLQLLMLATAGFGVGLAASLVIR